MYFLYEMEDLQEEVNFTYKIFNSRKSSLKRQVFQRRETGKDGKNRTIMRRVEQDIGNTEIECLAIPNF